MNPNTKNSLSDKKKGLVCSKCGWKKKNYYENYQGVGIIYGCKCEREIEVRKVNNEIAKEKKNLISNLFSNANLGKRFANCTFDNFKQSKGAVEALNMCREFAENFPKHLESGSGLLIYGIPGNGKTHLVSAVVKEVIQRGHSAIFQSAAELMYRLNATYNDSGESELAIMKGLVESDLTAIDDLGKGKWSEKVSERFYVILDGRYRELKPTLVTTNLKLKELEDYVGIAVFDRMKEMMVFVNNTAESYRG